MIRYEYAEGQEKDTYEIRTLGGRVIKRGPLPPGHIWVSGPGGGNEDVVCEDCGVALEKVARVKESPETLPRPPDPTRKFALPSEYRLAVRSLLWIAVITWTTAFLLSVVR